MDWWQAALTALGATGVGAVAATYGALWVGRRQAQRETRADILTRLIPDARRATEEQHDNDAFLRGARDVERRALVAGDRVHVEGLHELLEAGWQKRKRQIGAGHRIAARRAGAREEREVLTRELENILDDIYEKLDSYERWLRSTI